MADWLFPFASGFVGALAFIMGGVAFLARRDRLANRAALKGGA